MMQESVIAVLVSFGLVELARLEEAHHFTRICTMDKHPEINQSLQTPEIFWREWYSKEYDISSTKESKVKSKHRRFIELPMRGQI